VSFSIAAASMTTPDKVMLVSAILAVPWTVLAGHLWWEPARKWGGTSPWLRYAVYYAAAQLTVLAIYGVFNDPA